MKFDFPHIFPDEQVARNQSRQLYSGNYESVGAKFTLDSVLYRSRELPGCLTFHPQERVSISNSPDPATVSTHAGAFTMFTWNKPPPP